MVGVPSETNAEKLGVLLTDVELLMSSHLLLTGQSFGPICQWGRWSATMEADLHRHIVTVPLGAGV